MLRRWFPEEQDWAALILRCAVGVVFFAHGAQKVLGWFGGSGWNGTLQFFSQNLGLPAVLGGVVGLLELIGGLLLIAGLGTRWISLLLALEMAGAVLKVHWRNGFFLRPTAPGIEYALVLFAASLTLMLMGPGRYSLDAMIRRPTPRERIEPRPARAA